VRQKCSEGPGLRTPAPLVETPSPIKWRGFHPPRGSPLRPDPVLLVASLSTFDRKLVASLPKIGSKIGRFAPENWIEIYVKKINSRKLSQKNTPRLLTFTPQSCKTLLALRLTGFCRSELPSKYQDKESGGKKPLFPSRQKLTLRGEKSCHLTMYFSLSLRQSAKNELLSGSACSASS